MKTFAFIFLLFPLANFAQEVHEILYKIDCPTDWQDSVMALQTSPPMILYCSPSHSTVMTNSPFSQCVDSRILDLPSWSQKTTRGYWVQYKGSEADSALIAFSFNVDGKAKKSETVLGFATKKTEARSLAFTTEKIEIVYTEALRGVHPWCSDLKGIPLRITIPTDLGEYVLEAVEVKTRTLSEIPSTPKISVEAAAGQEVKENFFYDPDSTSLIVFGVVSDEFSGDLLGLTDVRVYEKDQLIHSTTTDIRGVYDLTLKCGGVYLLEFGTAPYIKKRIQLELLTMRPTREVLLLNLDGSIFQNPKNLDCSMLQAPILKLYYDMNAKEIAFDEAYNQAKQAQLQLILDQLK